MKTLVWVSLVAAAGLSSLAACRKQEPPPKPLTPVTVSVVEQHRGSGAVRYSGNIEPRTRVDLAFRVGGYVREILTVRTRGGATRLVQEGDTVTNGAVLARLRETDYEVKMEQARSQLSEATLALGQAKSQLQEAQAALEHARADFARARTLFESQSLTRSDFDGAKARLEMTEARWEAARTMPEVVQAKMEGARALVREAELAASDSALKAPMEAMVLKRLVEIGSLVGPGSPGFILADTSSMKIVFGAPDSLLSRLQLGASLPVTTEAAPGTELSGRITRISAAADPRSRVFDVELTVPNPSGRLKAGMIAAVEVPGERLTKPALAVPVAAIVRSAQNQDGFTVFVIEERDQRATAHARKVKLGEPLGNRIAVTEGLRNGERVIVTGATLVRDGEPVEIVQESH